MRRDLFKSSHHKFKNLQAPENVHIVPGDKIPESCPYLMNTILELLTWNNISYDRKKNLKWNLLCFLNFYLITSSEIIHAEFVFMYSDHTTCRKRNTVTTKKTFLIFLIVWKLSSGFQKAFSNMWSHVHCMLSFFIYSLIIETIIQKLIFIGLIYKHVPCLLFYMYIYLY